MTEFDIWSSAMLIFAVIIGVYGINHCIKYKLWIDAIGMSVILIFAIVAVGFVIWQ
jgi:hypothetical protein